MSKFWCDPAPSQAPLQFALERQARGLMDGSSCFSLVGVWVIPKGESKAAEWLTNLRPWKAHLCCDPEHNVYHDNGYCQCFEEKGFVEAVCRDNKVRCRCKDAEQRAEQDIRKAAEKKGMIIVEMVVYSELRLCPQCYKHFENVSRTEGIPVSCFWSAENNSDLAEQLKK
jgi:hypothetical protein